MSGFCVYIFALNCVCLELNWIYECIQWDCVTDSLDGNITVIFGFIIKTKMAIHAEY